jgi:hypothetical protein
VEDILTVGKDRRPVWWKRGLVVVAVAAAVAVVALRQLSGDQDSPADYAPPAVVAGEPVPRIMPVRAGEAGGRHQLPLMRGVRLPVAGPRPFWFWPATGRAEPIGGLPVTGAGYTFLRVAGGWALTRSTFARPACGLCLEAPLPVYFLADHAIAARWTGTADAVARAAAAGRLWLTSYRQGDDPAHAAVTAREVGANGRTLGPAVRIPAGYAIDGATSRGLLLAPTTTRGGLAVFWLWKPGAEEAARRFGTLLAVNARQIAWMPRCAQRCAIEVADVVTGQVTAVRLQSGHMPVSAAFSPDGTYLAVQVSTTRLYVVSIRSRQVAAVPGTRAAGGALVGFGWPDDADTLLTELSFPARLQLEAWRPGAARPEVIALEPGHGASGIVVG